MRDLSARTAIHEKSKIVGKFDVETINNKGHRLIKICQQHKLKMAFTRTKA